MARCPQCGAECDDDAAQCASCGALLDDADDEAWPPAPIKSSYDPAIEEKYRMFIPATTDPNQRTHESQLPVAARLVTVLAALAAAAAMLGLGSIFMNFSQPTIVQAQQAPESGPPAASADDADDEPANRFSGSLVQVEVPERSWSDDFSWTQSGTRAGLNVMGQEGELAVIAWGDGATTNDDYKYETYSLGTVSQEGRESEVLLVLHYADDDGSIVQWDGTGDVLAIEEYLGVNARTFASWVQLAVSDGEFAPAYLDVSSREESSGHRPFWPIIMGSFPTESAARDYIRSIESSNISDLAIFKGTDWAEINYGTYYIVTAGKCSTEEDARAMVQEIWNMGYTGSYVDYTGAYQG